MAFLSGDFRLCQADQDRHFIDMNSFNSYNPDVEPLFTKRKLRHRAVELFIDVTQLRDDRIPIPIPYFLSHFGLSCLWNDRRDSGRTTGMCSPVGNWRAGLISGLIWELESAAWPQGLLSLAPPLSCPTNHLARHRCRPQMGLRC